MSRGVNENRRAIAKTAPLELLSSSLLEDVFSPANWNPATIEAQKLDLAGVAIKRLTSFVNNGTPDVQAGALDFVQSTFAGTQAAVIARTIFEGMSTVVDKSLSTKSQDLLQLFASLCLALAKVQQHEQAQKIATPFVEQVVGEGSTTRHLGAAGAKPAILILWSMQSFVPVQTLPTSLIEDVLGGIDVSGESSYRGRLISALMQNQAYIETFGFQTTDQAIATFIKRWYQPGVLSKSDSSAIGIHLLPLLLEKRADIAKAVLQDLRERIPTEDRADDKYAYIPAWTAIARVGVVTSGVKLAELDPSSLECAINHGDDEIRLDAWFILSQCPSPTDQIEQVALGEDGLLFRWFSNNMAVSNMEFRNDYLASFGRFVERSYTSANFAIRQSQKPLAVSKKGDAEAEEAFEQKRQDCIEYARSTVDFVEHLLRRFIDKSIFLPMSTYHARIITALSMLSYLEEHLGAGKAPKKAGKNQVTWPKLFTKKRVECLIACLGSNFTDVRNMAADLLQHAPYPLPGFEDSSSNEALLEAALDRLNGARNTDAEAGGLLIQVLYHSLRGGNAEGCQQPEIEASPELELLFSIYGRLEERLERISGSATLAEEPLHGLILAMIRIVSCWTRTVEQIDYTDFITRIMKSVERIWNICRPIIATQQGDDNQHEIAGAYDVLEGNVDGTEQLAESTVSKADNVHLTILSNCWRAIKEASDLMATVFTRVPAGAVTPELASSAGDLYMRWLRHIRHRGTFSSMAIAFELFLDSPAIPRDFRKAWLQQQLDFIAEGDAETTRRSGALPYAVLALVHADTGSFDKAFIRLAAIVKDSERNSSKIHAMHSIRVMLLDARHSHLFKRYFEESIIISLDAYQTEDWSVRNAALLLSANLTNRAIGKSLNDLQFRTSRRPTLDEWIKLYPRTLGHFEMILERSRNVDDMSPAAFIALLILRSLDTTSITNPTVAPTSLTQKLKPLLAKREIKARQAAAQALANLSSGTNILTIAEQLCRTLEAQANTGLNEVHGLILVLEAFLEYRPLNQEITSAMEEFKSRFLSVEGMDGWPPLIRDSLSYLVNLLGRPTATSRKDCVANANHSEVNSSSKAHLLDNGVSSLSSVTLQTLLAGDVNSDTVPVDINTWTKLYHTYTTTMNEPLRNVLLPVLGDVASALSNADIAKVLRLIEDAGQDDKSEDSRQAAVLAFRHLAGHLRQSMPQQLFNVADLLLHDDDTSIRSQAAECIGLAFQTGYPICQEAAKTMLWAKALETHHGTVQFAQQVLAELTNPRDIEEILEGLGSGAGDLFAEEPANLYVEPYTRKQQLFSAFAQFDESARQRALQTNQERIQSCKLLLDTQSDKVELERMGAPLDKRREGYILLQQLSSMVNMFTG